MPPQNRNTPQELFREFEQQLAALRASAKLLRDERPSWSDNVFHPGRRARQEADFGGAIVAAFKELCESFRSTIEQQETRIAELDRGLAALRDEQQAQLREQQEHAGRERAAATADSNQRIGELRERVEQFERDHAAKIEALANGQKDLANEFRERLQHLLDEHRVALRQLAFKVSEDAVLADRARRATELKLEELAKRVPPAPPA